MFDIDTPIPPPLGPLLLEAMEQIKSYRECCIVLSRVIVRADILLRQDNEPQARAILADMGKTCAAAVAKFDTHELLQRGTAA